MQGDPFKKYLLGSTLIHVVTAMIIFFSPVFSFRWKEPTKVTWIKLSKGDGGTNIKANQKDLKTLPQSTIREQKEAIRELAKSKTGMDRITKEVPNKKPDTKPKVITQQKTSEKGGINLDKKTPVVKKSTNIDDALSRIEQQLQQREVETGAAQAKKEATGQSPFGSDEGSTVDAALISYYNLIKQKINKEWIISKGEFAGALKTKIVVLIDGSGNIIRTEYEGQSGDISFDESAMRALKRAAPFPTPPVSIRDEAIDEGFLIEFNPRAVTGKLQ
jgi:outer membrane biosynthesis protein TonB